VTIEDQAFLSQAKHGFILTVIIVIAGVSFILWRLRRL